MCHHLHFSMKVFYRNILTIKRLLQKQIFEVYIKMQDLLDKRRRRVPVPQIHDCQVLALELEAPSPSHTTCKVLDATVSTFERLGLDGL